MFHNSPIPRTESRCRASQECCSMTKKLVHPTHNALVTFTWRVLPRIFGQEGSQVQSFLFLLKKTVLTHISCRDGATVNTIFSLSSEIAGFTSSLAKPVHGSVPLVMQRFDSLSKFVTKHTRLDRDDDARSSYNLNTRYCDSSSPSQVSGQKNPAQRPLISFCRRRREKLCTATLPWRSKIGTRWRDEDVQLQFKLNPRNHPVSRTGVSILMLVDMKAALSHALERTLMLALARPARYTQVCLRGSHAHAHLHGEFGTGLAFRQRIMCHTHVASNEKNFRLQQKNMHLHASSPSTPAPPDHSTTHMFSTCPTMNLRNLQHPSSLSWHLHARTCLLRKPLRALSFMRSSVPTQPFPLYTRPTNDASTSKRRRRDRHNNRWAKAERSRLDSSRRAFYFGAQAQ